MLSISERAASGARWRDALAALSLANLVYYRPFGLLLERHSAAAYWTKVEPGPLPFVLLMSNVLLLAVLFFLTFRAARRLLQEGRSLPARAGRAAIALIFFVAFALLIRCAYLWSGDIAFLQPYRHWWTFLLLNALGALVPVLYLTGCQKPLRLAYQALFIFLPLVVFTFGQGIHRCVAFDPGYLSDKPLASRFPAQPSAPHVVWIIFDEWDADLTFSDRPPELALPEIDRFRQSAFYADSVSPPGMATDVSMPALITGTALSSIVPNGPSDLNLTTAKGYATQWSRTSTVFSKSRKLGMNTGVVGWNVPYCRVLSGDLTDCYWLTDMDYFDDDGVFETLTRQIRTLLWEEPSRPLIGQAPATRAHAWLHVQLLAKARQYLADGRCNLLLLHLPIPHSPFFYDRFTGQYDLGTAWRNGFSLPKERGYPDALALVDRTIGELRRDLESNGAWDSTTLLLSADHPFRDRTAFDGKPVVRRVPFLVKLAGQDKPLRCSEHFSALLTHDLLLALLRKEISTPEELNAWIVRHKDSFPAN